MKRLLGLLLVMGMVGCGQSENAGDAVGHASIGASESSLAKISSEIRRDENGNITFVDLRTSRPLTDAMLVHLTGLNKLEYLTMAHMEVTDAGLIHLKGLTNLEAIWLSGTKVTGEGLVHLKGLPKLQELDLDGTPITDAELVHLKGLTSLRKLYLTDTKVTDAGLVHLKGLTKLTSLGLKGTQVTDAGIAQLAGMNLNSLGIPKSAQTDLGLKHHLAATEPRSVLYLWFWAGLTDAGLVHLKGLTDLQELSIEIPQITDAGLVHLKELTKLEELGLAGTKVTDAGIAELQKALPNCKITK